MEKEKTEKNSFVTKLKKLEKKNTGKQWQKKTKKKRLDKKGNLCIILFATGNYKIEKVKICVLF